ncbi:MAG: CapA family protein [Candidatus Paceibacterota bacterium]
MTSTLAKVNIISFGLLAFIIAGYLAIHLSAREVFIREFLAPEPERTKPLLFTGDIMLGRHVEDLMNKNGLAYPFASTTDFLKSHVTISNLEGPIPEEHIPTKTNGMTFSFPSRTPTVLKENGIAAVSLANNHALDQKVSGYEYTKLILDHEGVAHFGGYSTTVPDYFETHIGTTSVVVYGINMISSTWNIRTAYRVTEDLQKEFPDSVLIAFIHWGNEYDLKQGVQQEEFAHALIDRGVDSIVGSHPHVMQGVELYKGVPIFYSLGNFIFDQYFSQDVERGYTLALDKKDEMLIYSIIPIMSDHSRPYFPSQEMSQNILSVIASNSSKDLQNLVEKGEIIVPLLFK